jgi:predicted MFS family arabinose efflux permease
LTPETHPLRLALGGLIAMAAAIGIGRFVYTPILPLMVESLGMSNTAAGALASANFAGYLVGALAAARANLPGSRRRWLLVALFISATTTAAMALFTSAPPFLALRFIGGFASAVVLVVSSALVLDRLSAVGRSGLSAVHFAGVGAGIVVCAVVVNILVAAGGDWRGLWLAHGLIGLASLGVVAYLIPDRVEPPLAARKTMPRHGGAIRNLVIAYGLVGFGYVITATFLVAIVRGAAELRGAESVVWLLVGLSAAPSVALWGLFAGRLGIRMAFALACALEAAGVAASVLWPALAGIAVAALLLGGTFMGLTALGLMEAHRLSERDPRRTLAVMTAAFGLGQILGPAFAGALYDATGSLLTPSLGAAAALLIAAALVWTLPQDSAHLRATKSGSRGA